MNNERDIAMNTQPYAEDLGVQSYRVWVLDKPSTFNTDHGKYDMEHEGTFESCMEYIQMIEPRWGWVISDDRNRALCSGEIPEAWTEKSMTA